MSYRRAAKIDANQPAIVKELRQAGYSVHLDCDDILVGKHGLNLWVEIKQPGQESRLTKTELERLDTWQGAYLVASSFEDIHKWFMGRGK